MLTKCTVQEAKSPVQISSGSVARRESILALKGQNNIEHKAPTRKCKKLELNLVHFYNPKKKALGTLPEDGNVMPKHVGDTIHN
jgi:hypothetical protein